MSLLKTRISTIYVRIFFFQAEDGIRDIGVTGVQTCALPISFDPPISEAVGKQVVRIHRIGKRIALELEGDLFLVIHLMIAGRLKWVDRGAKVPGKVGLAAIDFPYGTLILTEAATKKRASLHFVRGAEAVRAMGRGGIEVLDAPLAAF